MARWMLLCACLFAALAFGYHDVGARASNARAFASVCESTRECRSDTQCLDVEGVMEGQCSLHCNADATCTDAFGAGALCLASDVCALGCKLAGDCPEQTRCNAWGWCERAPSE